MTIAPASLTKQAARTCAKHLFTLRFVLILSGIIGYVGLRIRQRWALSHGGTEELHLDRSVRHGIIGTGQMDTPICHMSSCQLTQVRFPSIQFPIHSTQSPSSPFSC